MAKLEIPPADATPQPKVVATGISGAVTVVILWLMSTYGNVDVPGEVAAAITTVIGFLFGYITSNR